jgi:hypothetical protein
MVTGRATPFSPPWVAEVRVEHDGTASPTVDADAKTRGVDAVRMPTGPEQVDAELAKLEALNRALVPTPSPGGADLRDEAMDAFVEIWQLSLREALPEPSRRAICDFLIDVWPELDDKTKEWMSHLDVAWANIVNMPPPDREGAGQYWNPILEVARASIRYYYVASKPAGKVQFRDGMRSFDVS